MESTELILKLMNLEIMNKIWEKFKSPDHDVIKNCLMVIGNSLHMLNLENIIINQ